MIRQFMSNVSMTTNMEKLLTLGRTLFKVEGCQGGGMWGGGEVVFATPSFFLSFFSKTIKHQHLTSLVMVSYCGYEI